MDFHFSVSSLYSYPLLVEFPSVGFRYFSHKSAHSFKTILSLLRIADRCATICTPSMEYFRDWYIIFHQALEDLKIDVIPVIQLHFTQSFILNSLSSYKGKILMTCSRFPIFYQISILISCMFAHCMSVPECQSIFNFR